MTDKILTTINPRTLEAARTDGAVLLIDKPLSWTSFDVVNKVRGHLKRLFHDKNLKVGHAGTLDPLASGLLIVCVGKMTKQIDQFMGLPKTYSGTMRLGATTPSYDAETEVNATFPTEHITPSVLEAARQPFLGEIQQLPPAFSAIKKDGKPLYESARAGIEVDVPTRTVSIQQFDIQPITDVDIQFSVRCSKGTYIRSLVHDFGKACGSGAYLTALQRDAIGDFSLENAFDMKNLITQMEKWADSRA